MEILDNALNSIHDIILKRFGETHTSPNGVIVAFEFGTPISLASIAAPTNPPTPSPARANELMAGMSNVVPDLHDNFFQRGLRTVDGQYEILLKGSQPVDASQLDLFGSIKTEALGKFEEVAQSVEGLHQFHPIGATPSDWFDVGVEENWSHFHVANEGQSPAAPLVAAAGPKFDPRLRQLRVIPAEMRPTFADPSIQSTLLTSAFAEASQPTPHLTSSANFQQDVVDTSNHQPVLLEFWATWCGPCRMLTPKLQMALSNAKTPIQWIRANVDVDALASFMTVRSIPTMVVFMNGRPGPPMVGMFDDAKLKAIVDDIDANFIPTGTNSLVIDLDMCIVQLNRAWLSDAFLSLKNWFVPSTHKGEFSAGPALPDPGGLNAVPIACVLVKNVSVVAHWTTADIETLEDASNLGPFSLHGHDFDRSSGTLSIKGMQSIAWVCAKMPVLPPADAAAPPA